MKRLIAAAALVLLLAGCSTSEPGGPTEEIIMPSGYSDVATTCDHGNRLYVVYEGIAVAPNDPTCAE